MVKETDHAKKTARGWRKIEISQRDGRGTVAGVVPSPGRICRGLCRLRREIVQDVIDARTGNRRVTLASGGVLTLYKEGV